MSHEKNFTTTLCKLVHFFNKNWIISIESFVFVSFTKAWLWCHGKWQYCIKGFYFYGNHYSPKKWYFFQISNVESLVKAHIPRGI